MIGSGRDELYAAMPDDGEETGGVIMRRLTVNVGLMVILVLFSFFLYNVGKGYTLLVDNKPITIGEQSFQPYPWVKVYISSVDEPVMLKAGGRDSVFVVGKAHKVRVEILDEGKNIIREVEQKFKLSRDSGDLLSIPALGENYPQWIQKRQ